MSKKEADLFELYAEDPEKADRVVFGRVANPDRRGFLKGAGLATMAAALGGYIPFHRNMPAGFIPAAMAEEPFTIEGKDGLTILNDRPVNAECPAHLLDDEITPTNRLFVRNNGIPPEAMAPDSWTLTIDGEVDQPMELSIAELKEKFEVVTLQLQLECGGNGRSFFDPKARGNQWTVGAVGACEWTGVGSLT
jgi:DMSO/TMAO reductase YedYZ molybdopterin-dependent catalytic subunit